MRSLKLAFFAHFVRIWYNLIGTLAAGLFWFLFIVGFGLLQHYWK